VYRRRVLANGNEYNCHALPARNCLIASSATSLYSELKIIASRVFGRCYFWLPVLRRGRPICRRQFVCNTTGLTFKILKGLDVHFWYTGASSESTNQGHRVKLSRSHEQKQRAHGWHRRFAFNEKVSCRLMYIRHTLRANFSACCRLKESTNQVTNPILTPLIMARDA